VASQHQNVLASESSYPVRASLGRTPAVVQRMGYYRGRPEAETGNSHRFASGVQSLCCEIRSNDAASVQGWLRL
jgi:hypothetical protein